MYFWKYSSICFLWEEKIPGVHGSGQEGFGMAREAEDRSTHIVYEKDRIGEVKIADEVVAIIAGLAATEVDGVDSSRMRSPCSSSRYSRRCLLPHLPCSSKGRMGHMT